MFDQLIHEFYRSFYIWLKAYWQSTGILDVVNTILYEDLTDVVLVGHSYGGMVITGVADSIPGRISKLIYLDALLPENDESLMSIFGRDTSEMNIRDGFIIPSWVSKGQQPPSDVPHPLKTWQDRLSLNNKDRLKINSSYILTVDKGKDPKSDGFASQAERARKKNWDVYTLEADHNAQWSAPNELVQLLRDIENKP